MTQTCYTCGAELPLTAFHKNHASRNGVLRHCKPCISARDQPKRRGYQLKSRYGITVEQYDEMLAAQGGGCAACGTPEPGGQGRFHVDHDHSCCSTAASDRATCGKCVRALLCNDCNLMLGYAHDDPDRLIAAAAYLLQFTNVLAGQ